jgi:RNA polymerase sigma-70 factor (ECF subfamily)
LHPDAPDGGARSERSITAGLRDLTDAELLAGIGRGEERQLAELQRRYWKNVVCYASTLVDPDAAEDVAQRTFIRVSVHAARWRPVGTVPAYLLHIARNLALNERRRHKNRLLALESAVSTLAGRTPATPGELFDESELRSVLAATLAAMPERRREVFGLIRFGGLSYADAAAVMGIAAQTVANQMSSAMSDLRRAVAPCFDDRE